MDTRAKLAQALLVISGSVLVFVVGGLAYLLFTISIDALRWWSALATIALPVVAVSFFLLGRVEARGQIAGLDKGINTVMKAANQTADLRAAHVREARNPAPTISANLEDIVIVPARSALPGESKIIEV